MMETRGGDDGSSNEESDNDMVVGAFYQAFNEMIWAGMIPWAGPA
jgi:hypothetical protein